MRVTLIIAEGALWPQERMRVFPTELAGRFTHEGLL